MDRNNLIGVLINKINSLISKIETKSLKIDSISEDPEKGLLCLILRINGKCTPPIKRMPYQFLMENGTNASSMLSQEDFNSLVSALLENQKRMVKKKYEKIYILINHKISEQNGEPLLVYQNIISKQYNIKPAKEVFTDLNLIQNFDSKDSACIGNIVGVYETEKELKYRQTNSAEKINNVVKFDSSASMSQWE